MATEILDKLSTDEYTLTSLIDNVRASTDKTKVDVALIRDPDGEADEFFKTTLYPFQGEVILTGVGELVEERFRSCRRITDTIAVVIDGERVDFKALYCKFELSEGFDCGKCFWTTSRTSIVHRHSTICLAHHHTGSRTYHAKVVGRDSLGLPMVVERDFTRSSASQWVTFTVNEIISSAMAAPTPEGRVMTHVGYFAIEYGELQKMFYVVDDPDYLTFLFKNMFNAPEYVDVVGKVRRKTVVDRDTATCRGELRQYNQVINRTYEVETGPLTADQALTLEQMICSYEVTLCGTPGYLVIITDHTCEVDNDDTSLTTIKFSFRLINPRPTLLDSEMGALTPSGSNIFSKEFTAQFA